MLPAVAVRASRNACRFWYRSSAVGSPPGPAALASAWSIFVDFRSRRPSARAAPAVRAPSALGAWWRRAPGRPSGDGSGGAAGEGVLRPVPQLLGPARGLPDGVDPAPEGLGDLLLPGHEGAAGTGHREGAAELGDVAEPERLQQRPEGEHRGDRDDRGPDAGPVAADEALEDGDELDEEGEGEDEDELGGHEPAGELQQPRAGGVPAPLGPLPGRANMSRVTDRTMSMTTRPTWATIAPRLRAPSAQR